VDKYHNGRNGPNGDTAKALKCLMALTAGRHPNCGRSFPYMGSGISYGKLQAIKGTTPIGDHTFDGGAEK